VQQQVTTSGVTRRGAKLIWRGPTSHRKAAISQHTQKKLRNNSESEYRGCLYQLKKRKHFKKQQPAENQKNSKYTEKSAKGGPVFTFNFPGGKLAPCPPSVTPLVTTIFSLK